MWVCLCSDVSECLYERWFACKSKYKYNMGMMSINKIFINIMQSRNGITHCHVIYTIIIHWKYTLYSYQRCYYVYKFCIKDAHNKLWYFSERANFSSGQAQTRTHTEQNSTEKKHHHQWWHRYRNKSVRLHQTDFQQKKTNNKRQWRWRKIQQLLMIVIWKGHHTPY